MDVNDGGAHAVAVGWLCQNLRQLRQARTLTQAQLSQAAGITRNHYQLLEAGRAASGEVANPRLRTLVALAAALGVRTESLLTEPSVHTIWRWSDQPQVVSENLKSELLDRLLDSSGTQTDGAGAAFVGADGRSLTMGIAIMAADEKSAVALAEPLFLRALSHVGLEPRLLAEFEVSSGKDGLVSEDEY